MPPALAVPLLAALFAMAWPALQDRQRPAEAQALFDRAKNELESGKTAEAIDTLTTVAQLFRELGDAVEEGGAMVSLASAYTQAGRRAEGLATGQNALTLCTRAADPRCEALAHYTLGTFRFFLGEYSTALDHYAKALSRWELLGERGQQALVLAEVGWLHWTTGATRDAIEHYLKALPLSVAGGDKSTEGYIRNNLGLAYGLEDADQALAAYEAALAARRAAADVGGEAQTLGNLCSLRWRLGEFQNTLDVCSESLRLAKTVNDRRSQAWALDAMGLAYWSLGDSPRALEHHREALALRRAADDRQGLATTLNNLGWVHLTLSEFRDARRYLDEALQASRTVKDVRVEALALNNLGLLASQERDYRLALTHLEAALALRQNGGDRRGEAQTRHNIGRTYGLMKQHQTAEEHYGAARDLFHAVGDRGSEANTLLALAAEAANLADLPRARRTAEEALALAESLRSGVVSQHLRTSYLAARQNYYELYIDVLMRLHRQDPRAGYDGLAFQASERARARSLLETLVETRAEIRQGVDPALLDRERTIVRRLETRERSRTDLLNRTHTPSEAAAAERELEALIRDFRDLQAEIRVRNPRYAAITQPQPLSLAEIQARVLDERSLLLEYHLGDTNSYVWAVTPASIRSYLLPPRAKIEAASRRLHGLLINSHQRLARAQTERAAEELSAMLLAPVAKELGTRRLVIVADGILHYVPFAALADPSSAGCGRETRYCPLMVGREVVSLPSASVAEVIRREAAGRPPASRTLAVFSDPVYEPGDARLGSAAAKSGPAAFERLPFSRREAEAIAAFAAPDRTLNATDFDASRDTAMRADLADFRYVHFATHGVVDSQRPELSGLVLSLVDRNGRRQDGLLRAHELYNLSLGAELVVLSACRTALGKVFKGEGIVGLARGFMYAGSPRVLASLWDVRDAATASLMTQFYRGVLSLGLSPAAALRRAQIEMWRSGTYEAPFYWAGFVLQGEWR